MSLTQVAAKVESLLGHGDNATTEQGGSFSYFRLRQPNVRSFMILYALIVFISILCLNQY